MECTDIVAYGPTDQLCHSAHRVSGTATHEAAAPRPPRMDGWAFRAEQAKSLRLESIPVVLFSAYALQPEVVDRMKVAGFLRKPMSLRALLDTVERFASSASDDGGATAQKGPR